MCNVWDFCFVSQKTYELLNFLLKYYLKNIKKIFTRAMCFFLFLFFSSECSFFCLIPFQDVHMYWSYVSVVQSTPDNCLEVHKGPF